MIFRKLVFWVQFVLSLGFNIDIYQPIHWESKNGSLFGFSVSPHYVKKSGEFRILVGAPLGNGLWQQHNEADKPLRVEESGALYSCPLTNKKDGCELLSIFAESTWEKSKKKGSFMGMNVISATVFNGSNAYSCAPRLTFTGIKQTVPGICAVITNELKPKKYFLGSTICQHDNYMQGMAIESICLDGMSITTNSKDQVLIGSPFSSPSRVSINGGSSTFYAVPEQGKKGKWLHNGPTPSPAYLGWSVGMGRILKSRLTSVSGGPGLPYQQLFTSTFIKPNASQIGMGFVVLEGVSKSDSQNKFVLYGTQFASRFGQALLVMDINSDGADDLLVAAPYYRSNDDTIGSGAVYVYMNEKGERLTLQRMLQPPALSIEKCSAAHCDRANYGFALSNLGDVNLDGFNDVGISAPGEGNGVIYIYHGSSKGLNPVPVQKLELPSLKQFGYSLGPGMDVDKNGYPDLTVGALGSNTAAVMRARPILRIEVKSRFEPKILDPTLSNNKNVPNCFTKNVCFEMIIEYSYRPASRKDKFSTPVPGNLTVFADFDPVISSDESRVNFFFENQLQRIVTKAVTFKPETQTVKLYPAIEDNKFMDKLNPLKFRVTWNLNADHPPPLGESTPLSSINNYPVYDKVNNYRNESLPWINPCPGGVCESDLQLSFNTSLQKDTDVNSVADYVYYMGQDHSIWMNFTVKNYVGHAYLINLTLSKNEMISLEGAKCRFECISINQHIVCQVANPLEKMKSITCNVRLSTSNLRPDMRYLNFSASLSTLSKNLNRYKTSIDFKASVKIKASIQLTRNMNHYQITYKTIIARGASFIKHEKGIGDERIKVTFKVENRLRSLIPSSTLTILWPYEIAGNLDEPHGKYLLYLLKAPLVESKSNNSMECDQDTLKRLINPINVRLLSDKPDNETEYTTISRYRRSPVTNSEDKKKDYVICSNGLARCAKIVCKVKELGKKTGPISISFLFRVWVHTLVSDFENKRQVDISIKALWKPAAGYVVTQVDGGNTETNATLSASNLMQLKPKKPKEFTLIIILSIVGGVILLGCLVIILWKCNFFKRTNLRAKRQELIRQSQFQE